MNYSIGTINYQPILLFGEILTEGTVRAFLRQRRREAIHSRHTTSGKVNVRRSTSSVRSSTLSARSSNNRASSPSKSACSPGTTPNLLIDERGRASVAFTNPLFSETRSSRVAFRAIPRSAKRSASNAIYVDDESGTKSERRLDTRQDSTDVFGRSSPSPSLRMNSSAMRRSCGLTKLHVASVAMRDSNKNSAPSPQPVVGFLDNPN